MMTFRQLFLQEQILLSAAELDALKRRRSFADAILGVDKKLSDAELREFVEPMLDVLHSKVEPAAGGDPHPTETKLTDAMKGAADWIEAQLGEWSKGKLLEEKERTSEATKARVQKSNEVLDELEDVTIDLKAVLGARPGSAPAEDFVEVRTSSATGEPFVSFVGMDRAGLALSGGGIRSATFNLGLLQGLHQYCLLGVFDYLSTVSGGGYIGGWWSAWKYRIGQYRNGQNAEQEFPGVSKRKLPPGGYDHPAEPDEIRHLREFSNFLVPRLGFFDVDMWYGVVAILSGLLPTLVIGASLIGLVWALFLTFNGLMNGQPPDYRLDVRVLATSPPACLALLTLIILAAYEFWWSETAGIKSKKDKALPSAIVFLLLAIIIAGLTQVYLVDPHCLCWLHKTYTWDWSEKLTVKFEPPLFFPPMAWSFAALLLLLLRYLLSFVSSKESTPAHVAAGSRVIGRLLGASVIWTLLASAWTLAQIEFDRAWIASGGALLAAAEMFRRIRGWMNTQPTKAQTGGLRDLVKPLLPQILAYVAVVVAFLLMAVAIKQQIMTRSQSTQWVILGVDLGLLVFLALVLNPEALGLHRFYQERIARAYLGASNQAIAEPPESHTPPTAMDNRRSDIEPSDDCLLSKLSTADRPQRPFHLICCTANDLAGDELANLSRMARSASLSPFGIAIGDRAGSTPDLSLSLAQTASAAAFNSQMGSLSAKFGPAVTFLMAALNLRLGLWRTIRTPNATTTSTRRFGRGWLLFKEFWSGSSCPVPIKPGQDVHLSDGGHFENLGLYELVRRHCRFIVVSDCGADPDYKFDDLGNALRRIRTDFGVEIEIDVTPLIPDAKTKKARQHMVVGTIYYGNQSERVCARQRALSDQCDQGLLLLFKPNLLGEEPDDIQQYHWRNQAFPQESTGDQFYDEAQWESYRRLGQHAAHSAFRFLERMTSLPSRYAVFTEAYWQWTAPPADVVAGMLEQTATFRSFTGRLDQAGSREMLEALLPELRELEKQSVNSTSVVPVLLELIQMMEDVFVALRLNETGTNPQLSGWDNLFRRATQSELFQRWWPVVEGLYGRPFREFLNDEYRLSEYSPGAAPGKRTLERVTSNVEKTEAWQVFYKRIKPDLRITEFQGQKVERLLMAFEIEQPTGQKPDEPNAAEKPDEPSAAKDKKYKLYLGELIYRHDEGAVKWHIDHFFPLAPYRGVNILAAYLEDIVKRRKVEEFFDPEKFDPRKFDRFEVDLTPRKPWARQRTDEAYRTFQANRLRIYMSLGFKLRKRDGRQYLVKWIRVRPTVSFPDRSLSTP